MASNVLTCSAAATTLVSNNRVVSGRSPAMIGLGQRSMVSLTPSLKTPSMVVRAQQGGSPKKMDPVTAEHFHKKVALLETSPYGKYSTPSTFFLFYIMYNRLYFVHGTYNHDYCIILSFVSEIRATIWLTHVSIHNFDHQSFISKNYTSSVP